MKAIIQYGEELKEKRPNLYSVSTGILLDCKYWLFLAGGLEATITFHCHDECMLGSALAWLKW